MKLKWLGCLLWSWWGKMGNGEEICGEKKNFASSEIWSDSIVTDSLSIHAPAPKHQEPSRLIHRRDIFLP